MSSVLASKLGWDRAVCNGKGVWEGGGPRPTPRVWKSGVASSLPNSSLGFGEGLGSDARHRLNRTFKETGNHVPVTLRAEGVALGWGEREAHFSFFGGSHAIANGLLAAGERQDDRNGGDGSDPTRWFFHTLLPDCRWGIIRCGPGDRQLVDTLLSITYSRLYPSKLIGHSTP